MFKKKILFAFFFTAQTSALFSQITEKRSVSSITFINNESINSRTLRKQLELKSSSPFSFNTINFDRRLLKLDAIKLKNYYNTKGFLEISVKDSFKVSENMVDIFFIIDEGKQYYLHEIQLIGLESLDKNLVLSILGLKLGHPYNPVKINTSMLFVDEALQEKGKLFADFDVQQSIEDSVVITININENKKVYYNNIWITGYDRIDSLYVRRELSFKKGDLFRKSLMDKTKRNILESGFFSSVSLIAHQIAGIDSLVNIEVRLREIKNVGLIDFEYGIDEVEYVPGVRSLNGIGGSIKWADRMIFGTKNRFDSNGSIVVPTEAGFVYPRFGLDMKFSNQRPFSFKIPTQINLFYQQFKNFGDEDGPYVRRFGLQYSNIFRWNRQRSFLDIGFRFELFDESEEFKNQIEQRKFKVHLHQDTRDSPLNPSEGNVFIFQLDAYGGPLGGSRAYTKFSTDLRQYLTIVRNITFAGRISAGSISGWSDEYDQYETILFEKFYLGGSNTLRAWRPLTLINQRNDMTDNDGDGFVDELDESASVPVGKTAKLLINFEIRMPLFWKLGAVFFYDGGLIEDSFSLIEQRNFYWNRGLGITLNLPVGPLRIDYAEQVVSPNFNQLHFGFLYSF